MHSAPQRRRRIDTRAWWIPALALLPFGWLTWAAFLAAGLRAQRTRWKLYSGAYVAASIALPIAVDAAIPGDPGDTAAGLVILGVYVFGVVHAFMLRPAYATRMGSQLMRAREAAQTRVHTREEALAIAERRPELAREMGIGRPDVAGAESAELVDINHVSRVVLETLPGIDPATALRIAKTRNEVGGFTSLADFGMVMDLDGHVVEGLRGHVVFL